MGKILIVILACFGANYLISDFWPEASSKMFTVHNYSVSYHTLGIVLAGIFVWRHKGK